MINLHDLSIPRLFGYIARKLQMTKQAFYGIGGLTLYPKYNDTSVKTISLSFDPECYTGVKLLVNKDWVVKTLLTEQNGAQIIEEFCRVQLVRLLNKHPEAACNTPDFGSPNWSKRACLASQLAAFSLLENHLPYAAKLLNIDPSSSHYRYSSNKSLEHYVGALKKDKDAVTAGGLDMSGIGEEDFKAFEKDKAKLLSKVKVSTMELAETVKAQGNTPAEMNSLIAKTLSPVKVPWTTRFRRAISGSLSNKETASYTEIDVGKLALVGPHTGLGLQDIILTPGPTYDRGPMVVLSIDESGSMDNREVVNILRILLGMRLQVQGMELWCVVHDCEVQKVFEVKSPDDVPKCRHTCGGTSFTPVFEWVLGKTKHKEYGKCKFAKRISTLIMATDGYGDAPPKEDVPPYLQVIWLITPRGRLPYCFSSKSGSNTVTYGERIDIDPTPED